VVVILHRYRHPDEVPKLMRIAQIAPLMEAVPPVAYGGTERVVAYLTDALIELGHDVTLVASGDSNTRAVLVPASERALRLDRECRDPLAHHIRQVELVASMAGNFDIVHFHTGFLHMPVFRRLGTPSITTLHGRLDVPEVVTLLDTLADVPLVSISNAQRIPVPDARWVGTVYNAIPQSLLPFSEKGGEYLVFIGRISPEKRVDRAIEIARRTGRPLKIAAKVDAADREYFDETIAPVLGEPGIEFLGEVDEAAKAVLLGGARALLFPIDWPEPFGMVVVESLACGTPVIAWPHGAVPELIEDGESGWIVDSMDAAVEAVARVDRLDRRACRAAFDRRFTADRMARDYEAIYETLTGDKHPFAEAVGA
jgi:glycosyltransferase involved in cell wall biosynthesis